MTAAGSLTDNGGAVNAGQFVSIVDINAGLLKFAPAANVYGNSYPSTTSKLHYSSDVCNADLDLDQSANMITVNVTSLSDAPSGIDKTVTTNEDTAYTFS